MEEWRSGHLVHRSASYPHGMRDLILNSMGNGGRSVAIDGEANVLTTRKGTALSEAIECHPLFILF